VLPDYRGVWRFDLILTQAVLGLKQSDKFLSGENRMVTMLTSDGGSVA